MTPRAMERRERLITTVGIVLLGIPVVGILMGGLYWLPACHLTRGREPYLTGLLVLGLAITLLLLGLPFGVPLSTLGAAWSACLALLLVARRIHCELSGSGHGLAKRPRVSDDCVSLAALGPLLARYRKGMTWRR